MAQVWRGDLFRVRRLRAQFDVLLPYLSKQAGRAIWAEWFLCSSTFVLYGTTGRMTGIGIGGDVFGLINFRS